MRSRFPEVLRFKARLAPHPEGAKSSLALAVPATVGKKLHGMVTIEGTINDHPFRAPLEGDASGHWLRVNQAMRRGARADAGDVVALAVLGPEPEPKPPADLRVAFASSPEAKALWSDLSTLARHDWIRWIEGAKQPETRARRVRRTIEQLSEGKRRPCCVNFYEFMLQRVRE